MEYTKEERIQRQREAQEREVDAIVVPEADVRKDYAILETINGVPFLVSAHDAEWIDILRWKAVEDGGGYVYIVESEWRIRLHRMIMGNEFVAVDHINGFTLDNRRENLRGCTRAENFLNSKARKGRRYKGIYYNGFGWAASISRNYKRTNLGSYKSEKEAAAAYDKGAIRIHGEFARLNFPTFRHG